MCKLIWVFTGARGRFPGGIFTEVSLAEEFIAKHQLSGILTQYPLDIGSYDWAKSQGYVSQKLEERADADFIGGFSSASFPHYHYENGALA